MHVDFEGQFRCSVFYGQLGTNNMALRLYLKHNHFYLIMIIDEYVLNLMPRYVPIYSWDVTKLQQPHGTIF